MSYPGIGRAAVIEELLDLVAPDVAQDAAIFRFLEKPGRAARRIEPVRPKAENLQHAPDGALPDKLAGVDGALDVQTLAVIHHVFAPRARGGLARPGELVQRRKWGFVGEVILAGLHHGATKRPALGRDGGGGDQTYLGVIEDFFKTARLPGIRILAKVSRNLRGIGIIYPLKPRSRFEQAIGLAIDMTMVKVRRGKAKLTGLDDWRRFAPRGVSHSVGLLRGHGLYCMIKVGFANRASVVVPQLRDCWPMRGLAPWSSFAILTRPGITEVQVQVKV